jgi:hypothetical protein
MNQIVHCIMDELPSNWEVIGNLFDDFVTNLIEEKGKKYWLSNV